MVVDQPLPRAGYNGLVAACDAYVSLHRAEGFGLTIAEAMAAGKPVIATGYSGNLEFMTDENSFLVPYELVQIPHGSAPYPNSARWAEPDRDAAAAAMRAVFESRDEARERGARGRRDIEELHGFDRAASFLTARLGTGHSAKEPPSDALERAAYDLMWGPDLDLARPWARRVRRAFRPVSRPYLDYQREIGSQLIEAIRERRRE